MLQPVSSQTQRTCNTSHTAGRHFPALSLAAAVVPCGRQDSISSAGSFLPVGSYWALTRSGTCLAGSCGLSGAGGRRSDLHIAATRRLRAGTSERLPPVVTTAQLYPCAEPHLPDSCISAGHWLCANKCAAASVSARYLYDEEGPWIMAKMLGCLVLCLVALVFHELRPFQVRQATEDFAAQYQEQHATTVSADAED